MQDDAVAVDDLPPLITALERILTPDPGETN